MENKKLDDLTVDLFDIGHVIRFDFGLGLNPNKYNQLSKSLGEFLDDIMPGWIKLVFSNWYSPDQSRHFFIRSLDHSPLDFYRGIPVLTTSWYSSPIVDTIYFSKVRKEDPYNHTDSSRVSPYYRFYWAKTSGFYRYGTIR